MHAHQVDPHMIYFVDSRSEGVRNVQSILSQLFCLAGRCFEQLEAKKRAALAYQRALAIHHACTEAFLFIARSPMLSFDEKTSIMEGCVQRCAVEERQHLAQFYALNLHQQHLRSGAPQPAAKPPSSSSGGPFQEHAALETVELAEALLYRGQVGQAFALTKALLAHDPLSPSCTPLALACMVQLGKSKELFALAHELMASQPKHVLSWYAVGCYYYAIGIAAQSSAGSARTRDLCLTYLRKACKKDKRFAHAHVLLGHTLSALEESDQALAAYRTASRLLPEDGAVWLSTGQELLRINSCALAIHALTQAQQLCPWNPFVLNEQGAAHLRLERYCTVCTAARSSHRS
jgi:anaphase-promoting complex subunit 6